MVKPGAVYTATSFYSAVRRACKRAAVEPFSPYDLRRSAATRVRAALSKEDARLLLGHVSTDTTQIYLLEEVKESIKVAKRLETVEKS
jgi:integrase